VNRTIGGIPLIYWIGALGVGVLGFMWFKKKSAGSTTATTGAAAKTPAFSQAQEVQDFQIFSALTGAQQGSDLNFLTEVAGLFAGGQSTGVTATPTGTGGGGSSPSPIPSPAPTGTAPPATVPASKVPTAAAPAPSSEPGYGAGVGELLALNPGLGQPGTNTPGITGYTVSYNGVPI
jgi:hypothetical protein